MKINKIEGIEDTFDVNLNKYELERLFLAIRTAIPQLTRSMDFDSITVTALLEIHNAMFPHLKDDEGQVTVGMVGGSGGFQGLLDRILGQ